MRKRFFLFPDFRSSVEPFDKNTKMLHAETNNVRMDRRIYSNGGYKTYCNTDGEIASLVTSVDAKLQLIWTVVFVGFVLGSLIDKTLHILVVFGGGITIWFIVVALGFLQHRRLLRALQKRE